MGVLEILRLLLGFLLVFFVPGFIAVRLFIPKLGWLEKVTLTMGISISVTILIGVVLAYSGAFSYINSIIGYVIAIAAMFIAKRYAK